MATLRLTEGMVVLDRYHVLASLPWGDARRPVALARDLRLAQHVDLVLSPDPIDTSAGGLFQRRADALAVLQHPALPTVLDMGLHDGHAVLVYRHVRGRLLADAMRREAISWTAERALRCVAALAAALGLAHAKGLCHGSFGPQSVLLEPDGATTILDLVWPFGTAQFGSLDLAPELHWGHAPVPQSDVYALGRLLQRLLLLAGAGSGQDAAWDIVRRATTWAPQERYADGAALARALDALARGAESRLAPAVVPARPAVAPRPRSRPAPATRPAPIAPPLRQYAIMLALGLAIGLAPFADIMAHRALGHGPGPAGGFLLPGGGGWRGWRHDAPWWQWRPDPRDHVGTPWDWSRPSDGR